MTDRELKRLERFLKSAEKAYELDLTIIGTAYGQPYSYRLIKNRYTNYKLKVEIEYRNYKDPEPYLATVKEHSRHVKSVRGIADYPRGLEKEIGGKIYHYDSRTFTKYFQRT